MQDKKTTVENDGIPQQKLALGIRDKKVTPMEKEYRKWRCEMSDLIKGSLYKGNGVNQYRKIMYIKGFMYSL